MSIRSHVFRAVLAALLQASISSAQSTNVASGLSSNVVSGFSRTLAVRVVDSSGAAVEGARVRASTRDARVEVTASTGADGAASLAVTCECLVEVDAPGFARAVVIVPPDSAATTVRLSVASVAEHVVVTASGRAEASTEAAKVVDVVTAQEIESRAGFGVADAVRTVPGLTVQQLGGPGAYTSIKMRGLRERDTAVLIDGVRFRDTAAPQGDATGFLGELYLANLDRVEVLRGSGSSVHGSHAVAGAINLVTRQGGGRPSGAAAVEVGQLGFTRASAHAGGGAVRNLVSYSVGASHTHTTDGIDGDDRATNTSLQARGDWRLTSSARVTVRSYVSDSDAALNESPEAIGPLPTTGAVAAVPFRTFTPNVNDPDARREGQFASTLASFDHRASARIGYSLAVHDLRTTRVYIDGPLGVTAFEPPAGNINDLQGGYTSLGARADLDWTPRHTTTARYEVERERYDSENSTGVGVIASQAGLRQTGHSVFVQHQWRSDRWQLATGARAQRFSLDRPTFAPSEHAPFAGASFPTPPSALTGDVALSRWFDASGTKLHVHSGNAYRAPSMFERAGVSYGSFGYTVYGDPRLGPERAASFDAGVDQSLAGGRVQVAGTWFHSRLLRVIAFGSVDAATDPFGRFFGYVSGDGRSAQGLELAVRAEPGRGTSLKTAYTFADSEAPAPNREGLQRASAIPAHQFSLLLTQQVGRMQASFELEAAGNHYVALFDPVTFGARAYEFDGVVKGDLAAAYVHPIGGVRLRIYGAVDNVFDRDYFVQGFRTAGRTARVGAAVMF